MVTETLDILRKSMSEGFINCEMNKKFMSEGIGPKGNYVTAELMPVVGDHFRGQVNLKTPLPCDNVEKVREDGSLEYGDEVETTTWFGFAGQVSRVEVVDGLPVIGGFICPTTMNAPVAFGGALAHPQRDNIPVFFIHSANRENPWVMFVPSNKGLKWDVALAARRELVDLGMRGNKFRPALKADPIGLLRSVNEYTMHAGA